jgi:hypothetical protein
MTQYLKELIRLHQAGRLNTETFDEVYSQAAVAYKGNVFARFFVGCDLVCSHCIFSAGVDYKFTPCLIGEIVVSSSPSCASELMAFRTLKFIQFLAALEVYANDHCVEMDRSNY